MSKPKVYIDGKAGTTGLQIYERLQVREDIDLLVIDADKRKDAAARRECLNEADLTILCLPDEAAREAVALIQNDRTRVIDCSTAHRTAEGWTYGLPELWKHREKIVSAKRVANPGCYATGAIVLLRPLIRAGFLGADYPVAIHALSGYTGGGNKAIGQYEAEDRPAELSSPRHYALGLSHKHIPEIMAQTGLHRKPIFCPIICDHPQGMVVAVPLFLSWMGGVDQRLLRSCYQRYYEGERLVDLAPETVPESGFLGSNTFAGRDDLEIVLQGNEEQAVALARFDNLGKGASGAAVQNMNLMLGFEETKGLNL